MTNLATVLKSEISRISRKEVRGDILALKKALGSYRTEIAGLKRRTQVLEQEVRRLTRGIAKAAPMEEANGSAEVLRFSAKSLASQRRRLGLSAHDCGLLVEASSQSIYNWEDGTTRPRPRHLAALAGLRKLGKKEATARLETLKEAVQSA